LTEPAAVPIVAYHSIANDHDHLLRHLSLPVAMFEQQLQYLDRSGFQTVTLYDIHRWLRGGAVLPARSIALTLPHVWVTRPSRGSARLAASTAALISPRRLTANGQVVRTG